MTTAYFRFTNRCNLQCRHCLYSCGPRGETMNAEDIDRVIEHFPADTSRIMVSGGEAFREEEKLFHILRLLNERKKHQFPKAEVEIETNGFWMRDASMAYANLSRLYRLVSFISVPSHDRFHKEQGLSTGGLLKEGAFFEAVKRLAKEKGLHIERGLETISLLQEMRGQKMLTIGLGGAPDAHPFGRGASLPPEDLRKYSSCHMWEYKGKGGYEKITISPDGKAYPCCWCVTPSIGSAIESPLEDLVEKMKQNEIFRAMIEEDNPQGAARVLGTYREEDAVAYKNNPCSKCEEVFRGLR